MWASKWNDRACLSRKARGVADSDLFMACLLQQVYPLSCLITQARTLSLQQCCWASLAVLQLWVGPRTPHSECRMVNGAVTLKPHHGGTVLFPPKRITSWHDVLRSCVGCTVQLFLSTQTRHLSKNPAVTGNHLKTALQFDPVCEVAVCCPAHDTNETACTAQT